MSFSNLFMLLLTVLLVVDNFAMRVFAFLEIVGIIFVSVKNKVVKKSSVDMVSGIFIIILNSLLDINLLYLNFIYFCVLGLLVYFKFSYIKFKDFYNLYLLLVVMKGVVWFWVKL